MEPSGTDKSLPGHIAGDTPLPLSATREDRPSVEPPRAEMADHSLLFSPPELVGGDVDFSDLQTDGEHRKETQCLKWKKNRYHQMKVLFQNLYELGYLTTAIDTGFSTQTDGNKSCLNFSRELDILKGWTKDILYKAMPLEVWEDKSQFPRASPVFWAIDLTRQLLADRTDNQGVFQVQESQGDNAHPERWSRQFMWELLRNFAGTDVYSCEGQTVEHCGPRSGELRNVQSMVSQGPKQRQLRFDALGDDGQQRAKAETLALLFKRALGREMAEGIVGGGEPNVFRFPNASRNHAVASRLHTTEGADKASDAKKVEKKELKGKRIDSSKVPGADELRLKLIAERDARRLKQDAPSSVSSTAASNSSTTSSIMMAVSSTVKSSSGTDKASKQSNVVRLEAGGMARMKEERKREQEAGKLERQLENAKLEKEREAEKAEDKAQLMQARKLAKETENKLNQELNQNQAQLHRRVKEEAEKLDQQLFQLEQPDTYSCRQTAPLKLNFSRKPKTMPPKVKTFVYSEKGTIRFRNVEQRERPKNARELEILREQAELLLTLRDDLELELQNKEKLWSQERAYGPMATQRCQAKLQADIDNKLAKLNNCWEQMCNVMPRGGKERIEAACAKAMAQLQGAPTARCEELPPVHPVVVCWIEQCKQERIEQLKLKSQLAKVKTNVAQSQLQLEHVSRQDYIAQAMTRVQCGRLGVRPEKFSDAVRESVGDAAVAPVRQEVKSVWAQLSEDERAWVIRMARLDGAGAPVDVVWRLKQEISLRIQLPTVRAGEEVPWLEMEPLLIRLFESLWRGRFSGTLKQ